MRFGMALAAMMLAAPATAQVSSRDCLEIMAEAERLDLASRQPTILMFREMRSQTVANGAALEQLKPAFEQLQEMERQNAAWLAFRATLDELCLD